jgi:hypothetical protein
MTDIRSAARPQDRIDITHEYELCAWARHFNASEHRVKEAVRAVGNRADRVREHLARQHPLGQGAADGRPSSH